LHCADIHLDSPLRGLAGYDPGAAERIRTASRAAFENLIDFAVAEEVAFVVIAGDLYDGEWKEFRTGLFFVAQMGRLAASGIPAFVLHGNHDAESQITRRLTLPDNVKTFPSRKPETFELPELNVAIHGQSYRQRDVTENLVPTYPPPIRGSFNIGVLHTGLGGMGGHMNYAPCGLPELVSKGYDYWALGHVHKGEILHQNPFIVFPGNLQGRHIGETGPKGATLVTIDGDGIEVADVHCDVVRWALISVAVDDCERLGELLDRIRIDVEAAINASEGRLLACRLELTGATSLHDELSASLPYLLAEARAIALAFGGEVAWVERIILKTKSRIDASATATSQDALGELRRLLPEALNDPDLLKQLDEDVGELVRRLPHEIRSQATDTVLRGAIDGKYADLVTELSGFISARLTREE